MKKNIDIIDIITYALYHNSFFDSEFPIKLKEIDVTPVHKKEEKYLKENYQSVNILKNVSKVYKRLIYDKCIFSNNNA